MDIGTHALDMALWLLGCYTAKRVSGKVYGKLGKNPAALDGNAFGPWDTQQYDVEDSAFGFIRMENGATILLETAWALNVRRSNELNVTLCGTKAGAELSIGLFPDEIELTLNSGEHGFLLDGQVAASENRLKLAMSPKPGAVETREWLKVLQGDGNPLVQPDEAYAVVSILDAIYRSSDTGTEIQF